MMLKTWGAVGQKCSTPFGIRGLFRASTNGTKRYWKEVLNAFRHQRSFQIQRPAHRRWRAWSAQRLSASEVFSVALQ